MSWTSSTSCFPTSKVTTALDPMTPMTTFTVSTILAPVFASHMISTLHFGCQRSTLAIRSLSRRRWICSVWT
ncbi:hypothetical protein BCR39DRAFT_530828 [Naematelia encephala]|uniref:Uncharacterized protein n=1 Tax=Naematelia encephala TaxID=71784 RepID=A0A1Y2B4W4_9TREE|nr:hypothetical protein BCR39DRAFT_530828 [Naematelia encephala]